MITVWRLEKTKYAAMSFTGEGARRVGGRWSHPGILVVYAAESLPLAILEKFVNLGLQPSARTKFSAIKATVPAEVSVEHIQLKDLPADWAATPPRDSTKNIGSKWAKETRSAVLMVPSAVAPGSFNYLLNPAHPHFLKITVHAPVPFSFDNRMWRK
jgi:RES domain-containing protein